MNNIKQILKYSDKRFKRMFGVSKRISKSWKSLFLKNLK